MQGQGFLGGAKAGRTTLPPASRLSSYRFVWSLETLALATPLAPAILPNTKAYEQAEKIAYFKLIRRFRLSVFCVYGFCAACTEEIA